ALRRVLGRVGPPPRAARRPRLTRGPSPGGALGRAGGLPRRSADGTGNLPVVREDQLVGLDRSPRARVVLDDPWRVRQHGAEDLPGPLDLVFPGEQGVVTSHRQLSISTAMAANVSVLEFLATSGSSR